MHNCHKDLKIVQVSASDPSRVLVEMSQEMYQAICYKIIDIEHEIEIYKKYKELKESMK